MKYLALSLVGLLVTGAGVAHATATPVNLGSAGSFAVLAGSKVTNTGTTTLHGNLGVSPGTAITGSPHVVGGSTHAGDAVALQAQNDLIAAYTAAALEPGGTNLSGQNLGGLTLTPGVYDFSSSAQLTGTLTLNAQGDPNAVFLFQIGSTLTTASNSAVDFLNGANGNDIFYQVGSSATLGTGTSFEGNILALTSITLNTGATIGCGRALARNGAVTLDTNSVSIDSASCGGLTTVPEPGSVTLMLGGLCGLLFTGRRFRT